MGSTTLAPVAARPRADYAQGKAPTTMIEPERPVPEAGPVPLGALPEDPPGAGAETGPAEAVSPGEGSAGPAEGAPVPEIPALPEIPSAEALEPEVLREILVGLTASVRPFVEGGGANSVEWRGAFGALRGEFTTFREETKAELVAFRGEFAVFRKETKAEIASLRVDFEAFRAETRMETESFRGEVKDLRGAVEGLRGEFDSFRVEIRTDFKDFRIEMEGKFDKFTAEMKAEFREFKVEMESKFEKFTAEVKAEIGKQLAPVKNWAIGGVIAVAASFVSAALFAIFGA